VKCRPPVRQVFHGAPGAGGHRRAMSARDPRPRLALVLAAGLLALCGCGANGAGDVRLRASSMTTPVDDQRLPEDHASAIRFAPP